MKGNKAIIGLLVLIIIILGVLCVLFATGKISANNNQNTETKANSNNQNAKETDYTGTFKNDDSSSIVITKEGTDYHVEISIYKLATFDDGVVDRMKDDILYISATDPSGNKIEFTFDYKANVLTVAKSTWELLKNGETFEFNKQ